VNQGIGGRHGKKNSALIWFEMPLFALKWFEGGHSFGRGSFDFL
jgi:hypothetical protein